jgi:hypothetical protein
MIYIYALRCPVSGEIRYIGKAEDVNLRLARHIATARTEKAKHHCARWIRTLLAQDKAPSIEVIRTIENGEDWRSIETQMIAQYLADGHPLTNQTVGGDGVSYINRSDRAAASAKLSAAMRDAWSDPSKKDRLLRAARNPELLKRRADKMNRLYQDPEFVAKKAAALKATCNRPEFIARMKEIAARPEVRAAKAAANTAKSPEVRAKQAAALKATWARKKAASAQ